jgi:RNA polymerase sigma factor (sigma-70 family)
VHPNLSIYYIIKSVKFVWFSRLIGTLLERAAAKPPSYEAGITGICSVCPTRTVPYRTILYCSTPCRLSSKKLLQQVQGRAGIASSIVTERRGRTITEESEWIERIIAGDRQVFRLLMDKYSSYLYHAVFSVLRSAKDAEDVTQEALIKIYASLPQYQHQGLKTWMTRIAINKAIDHKRALERKKEQLTAEIEELLPSDGIHSVEEAVFSKQRRQQLRQYLDDIPANYREVVVAYYMEEKSYQEIAEEQGVALKTVESKLYRAKQWIRKHWKEEEWG